MHFSFSVVRASSELSDYLTFAIRPIRTPLIYIWKVRKVRATYSVSLFRAFSSIAAASLLAVVDGSAVERSADNLVTNTWEVLNTTAADKHHRVLLEVVADSRDVCRNFHAIYKAHTANLTKSRVRLFRGCGVNTSAYATLLRVAFKSRSLLFVDLLFATLAY
jgi:hypothetical protein